MKLRIRLYIGTFALLLSVATAHAQEEDKARAKQMFEQGVSEYEGARYQEALDDFLEAYRLKPHPLVRVNIANCYEKLDRPVEAVLNFELFLDSGAGSPEQRAEVKEALKGLKKRVGKLVLIVTPDGARVTIDETDQRTAPVREPLALRAGQHKVVAELGGYETVTRELEIKGEGTSELSLRLERLRTIAPTPAPAPIEASPEPEPAPVQEPAPTAEPEPAAAPAEATAAAEPAPRRKMPMGVWVAGGAAIGLAVAGTITGVLAKTAEKNFDDNRKARFDPALTSTQQAIAWNNASSASNRTLALAITTDVLFAGAIVSAGLATYLFFKHKSSDEAPRYSFAPSITPTTASLTARAAF